MKRSLSFMKKILLNLILFSFLLLLAIPQRTIASDSINPNKLNKLQERIAKGYSDKFCNGIGIGISKDGAARLAISENKESKFNPLLWFELASSGEENIEKIDQDELSYMISNKVINSCGSAIGLTGQKGVESFQEYFMSIKKEIESQ
tara:strand:+ start:1008 stop:1451 length:444 start_codon:yes stop_codon:yes gene_type:complete